MKTIEQYGKLEVIFGPMFAGKTSALNSRLNLYHEMNLKIIYINSKIDNRSQGYFSTHNKTLKEHTEFNYTKANSLQEIWTQLLEADVIGIDEGQFIKNLFNDVIELVETHNKIVIVCGLDTDYRRLPFGEILDLTKMTDTIQKLRPFCKICRDNGKIIKAIFTLKHTNNSQNDKQIESNIDVGGSEKYYPVCRQCYLKNYK